MEIKDILKKSNVFIIDQDLTWKEAVYKASKPLVDQGYVEERYPDEIIKNTLEFGPYFILVDDVAFLHVRPEQGVLKNQMTIMVDKKSVVFDVNDSKKSAKLFLTLAATGSEDHLLIMQKIAELLSDENTIQEIIESDSTDHIYDLMIN